MTITPQEQLKNKILERDAMLDNGTPTRAISDEIWTLIHTQRDALTFEAIFEALTHLGWAPQLVYDDNGRFAVSCDGVSPVFDDHTVRDADITAYTTADQWHDTVRGALYHMLDTALAEDRA